MKNMKYGIRETTTGYGIWVPPGPGKQESPKFGHGYGIRKENGIRDNQFSQNLGMAITGPAREGILVNQEREYGKKIRRELNMTVVCWCWIVQDEKENVQTLVA